MIRIQQMINPRKTPQVRKKTPSKRRPQNTTFHNIEESYIIAETQAPSEPTIIPETKPIATTQKQNDLFSSPSLATNTSFHLLQNTPDPHDISTPEITLTYNENDNRNNQQSPTPKTRSQLRQEYKKFKAKKLTIQLQTTSFCDATNDDNCTMMIIAQ